MAFTAKDVATLREKTGCGMMDCKKALTESDGNMDKAVDFLREKGLAAAAKKSGRIAAEGTVYSVVDGNVGVIVEVNSETDFVSKNADFQAFVADVAKTIADSNPVDVDALLNAEMGGSTVADVLRDKILTIGENLVIRRFERAEGDIISYIHGGGRIAVMVQFDTDVASKDGFIEYAKDVAMQIAALNPQFVDRSEVSAEELDKEREILLAQIKNDPKNASKPQNIVEKMVEGRIGKFYENYCLVDQAFVKSGDVSVGKHTEIVAKELGGSIAIKSFIRYEKGEGLQKREDNFADEVASMVK